MKRIFVLLALLIPGSAICGLPPICQEIASLHNRGKLDSHYLKEFSANEISRLSGGVSFEAPAPYEETGTPGYLLDINGDGTKEFIGYADYGTGHFGSLRIWSQEGKLLSSHDGQSDGEYTGLGIAVADIKGRNYVIGPAHDGTGTPFRLFNITNAYKAETICFFKYTGEYIETQKINKIPHLCAQAKQGTLKPLPITMIDPRQIDESNTLIGQSNSYDVNNDGKIDHVDLLRNSFGCCSLDFLESNSSSLVSEFFSSEIAYREEKANLLLYKGKIILERKFNEDRPASLHALAIVSHNKLDTVCSFDVRFKILPVSPEGYEPGYY